MLKASRFFCIAAPLLLAGLFLVFPIPHTTALRNVALLVLLGFALTHRPVLLDLAKPSLGLDTSALAMLTFLMILQTLLWAADLSYSFDNLTSEWLGSLLVAATGFGVMKRIGNQCGTHRQSQSLAWIALALLLHGIWTLGHQAIQWQRTGIYHLGSVPYGDYAILSIPINMAFALLVSDVALRFSRQTKLFSWDIRIALGLMLFASFSVVAVKARNGVISAFAVLVVLAIMLAWEERKKIERRRAVNLTLLLAFLMAGSLLFATARSDARWTSFAETASIAWDTESHRAWQGTEKTPLPLLSSGQSVDESAYLRVAWAKVALEGILHQPLGYGYGLGGFGRYLEEAYGLKGAVSSHSGILDFTLANGLPGLTPLLVFCGLLFRRGWLSWTNRNPWGLALVLTLTNYFVRILLDGHFGGFRLKMFALLIGILCSMSSERTTRHRVSSAPIVVI